MEIYHGVFVGTSSSLLWTEGQKVLLQIEITPGQLGCVAYAASRIQARGASYWSFHKLGDITAFKKGPNQGRAFRHSL